MADQRGVSLGIDSAGTGGWHAGDPADSRMRAAAKKRGYKLTSRARQVSRDDFDTFDLIIAMDRTNLGDLREIAPPGTEEKIRLCRSFEGVQDDVPDPYYGGASGFEDVLDIVERCCESILDEVEG